jgi:hypothetical protein
MERKTDNVRAADPRAPPYAGDESRRGAAPLCRSFVPRVARLANEQSTEGSRAEKTGLVRAPSLVRVEKEQLILELTPEFRHHAAAARVASLRHSAEPSPPGPLRRVVGRGLVRLGLRLGYAGPVPPVVSQLGAEGTPAPAGVASPLRAARAS